VISREQALHGAVLEACFGASAPAKDPSALLERHGVDPRDRRAIAAAKPRLALYRKLVRGNVEGVCEAILERGFAHLEAHAPGAWAGAVEAYLAGGGPRTPHLRDVPSELGAVLLPRIMQDARVPRYVPELFLLELAEFRVGAAPDPILPAALGDVAVELPVVLRGPSERLTCAHPVHHATPDPASAPRPEDTRLFVYRDAGHEVRVVVLSTFADELLARLLTGSTLGSAIGDAAHACAAPVTEALLTEVAKWLADFGERGVLLGAQR